MLYKCPKCLTVDRSRGGPPICPKCGTRMKLGSDVTADVATASSSGRIKKPKRKAVPRAKGRLLLKAAPKVFGLIGRRSGSAPMVTKSKLLVTAKFTQMVADVMKDSAWFDASQRGLRPTYERLDPNGAAQALGLWIKHPAILSSTDAELHNHFEHLAVEMLSNHKTTDATEATEEAAAAFAVATDARFSGFRMRSDPDRRGS